MRRRHGDGAVDGITQLGGEGERELGTLREAHHPDRVVTGEALAKHLDTPLDVLERNLDESIWQAGTAEVAERECGDTAGGELASGSLGIPPKEPPTNTANRSDPSSGAKTTPTVSALRISVRRTELATP